jgi:hypothetical protein
MIEKYLTNDRTIVLLKAWQMLQVWQNIQKSSAPIALPKVIREHRHGESGIRKVSPVELYLSKDKRSGNPNYFIDFRVIQYWSQGNPPRELQVYMEKWIHVLDELGLERNYQLYDRAMAREWISSMAPQFLKAFDTSFHYAVEADVFRLAYTTCGNVMYIDADMHPSRWASGIIKGLLDLKSSVVFMPSRRPTLNNCFFLGIEDCTFFLALRQSCQNIDFQAASKTRATILSSFGPDKYTNILRRMLLLSKGQVIAKQVDAGIVLLSSNLLRLALVNDRVLIDNRSGDLAYKSSSQNWERLYK